MSADTVITVENLGKRYTLNQRPAEGLLRDKLARSVRAPLDWIRRQSSASAGDRDAFWALREVNFSINRGDVVGIIGRNGAGKSTLLKILSRITEPTTGRVKLRGRVASLLEVGTGFHPELSGRENIALNGAILGMTRAEIRKKFDEIVAFAEVERFIDTPVKHYSSGMYVRLAFAVAAHLEPEILIVDEVLAVGDIQFQKKCLGKMDEVARTSGRTVLFVSHNMDAVLQLCSSAILLQNGRLASAGPTERILQNYLQENRAQQSYLAPADKRQGILRIASPRSNPESPDLIFRIEFACSPALKKPTLGIVIYSMKDVPLFGSNTLFHPWLSQPTFDLTGAATLTIRDVPLWSGTYKASFWLSDEDRQIDAVLEAVTFDLVSAHLPQGAPPAKDIGSIHVRGEWSPQL